MLLISCSIMVNSPVYKLGCCCQCVGVLSGLTIWILFVTAHFALQGCIEECDYMYPDHATYSTGGGFNETGGWSNATYGVTPGEETEWDKWHTCQTECMEEDLAVHKWLVEHPAAPMTAEFLIFFIPLCMICGNCFCFGGHEVHNECNDCGDCQNCTANVCLWTGLIVAFISFGLVAYLFTVVYITPDILILIPFPLVCLPCAWCCVPCLPITSCLSGTGGLIKHVHTHGVDKTIERGHLMEDDSDLEG